MSRPRASSPERARDLPDDAVEARPGHESGLVHDDADPTVAHGRRVGEHRAPIRCQRGVQLGARGLGPQLEDNLGRSLGRGRDGHVAIALLELGEERLAPRRLEALDDERRAARGPDRAHLARKPLH